MLDRLFSKTRGEGRQEVSEISTVIWLAEYHRLELEPEEQKNEFLKKVGEDINNALSTIQPSCGEQVYLSYSDFINAFDDLRSVKFSNYNCFTVLSLPTKYIKTATTVFAKNKKQLTWIIEPFVLEEHQIQSCLILNEALDSKKPIASLLGRTYFPLAALLASPVPDLEKILEEIKNLYKKEKLRPEKSIDHCFFASKKHWKNLLFDFVFSENAATSLKQKLIKQAIVNLLISSPTVCAQFENILSTKLQQKSLPILPPVANGIIQEYMQPKAFRF